MCSSDLAEGPERANYASRAAATLRRMIHRWAAGGLVGAGLVGTGVVLVTAGQPLLGGALSAAGLAVMVAAGAWMRRNEAVLRGGQPRHGMPRLVSLELLPRDRELERHH